MAHHSTYPVPVPGHVLGPMLLSSVYFGVVRRSSESDADISDSSNVR